LAGWRSFSLPELSDAMTVLDELRKIIIAL